MTIEELKNEKTLLKEKIEKALNEFYEATNFQVSGEFDIDTEYQTKAWGMGRIAIRKYPVVTINPIEI